MPVEVAPATFPPSQHGYIKGEIVTVSPYPVSEEHVARWLDSPTLAEQYTSQGPVLAVRVRLIADATTPTGFAWTSGPGPDAVITAATPVTIHVLTATKHPIALLTKRLAPRVR